MNKLKPAEIIARDFSISIESAKYFLGRVQKSFKKDKPPQALIIEFMENQPFDSLPKPYQVAKMMYDVGLWAFPMNSEPRSPEDEEDIYQ